MFDDYCTGLLVEPSNPVLLASKICELLANKNLRLSLGSEAKKIAFQRWSIKHHVRKIEEVYKMIYQKYHKKQ